MSINGGQFLINYWNNSTYYIIIFLLKKLTKSQILFIQICSGDGKCVCGECVCSKQENADSVYSGAFCEKELCEELEGYAHCNYMNNKTYCDQLKDYNQTSYTDIQMLNKSVINNATWPTAKWCHKSVDNGTLVFVYIYDKSNKKLQLIIQNELEEVLKPNLWSKYY
jgi:hypothetical protein